MSELSLTPQQADAKLAELHADKAWVTNYLAGNGPQVKEASLLLEAKHAPVDNLDAVVNGTARPDIIEINGQTSIRNQMSAAADLRGLGVPDAAIHQLLEGKPVSKSEYENVVRLRSDRMSDAAFTAKYLKGEREALLEMHLINIVIAGGYREEQAA